MADDGKRTKRLKIFSVNRRRGPPDGSFLAVTFDLIYCGHPLITCSVSTVSTTVREEEIKKKEITRRHVSVGSRIFRFLFRCCFAVVVFLLSSTCHVSVLTLQTLFRCVTFLWLNKKTCEKSITAWIKRNSKWLKFEEQKWRRSKQMLMFPF